MEKQELRTGDIVLYSEKEYYCALYGTAVRLYENEEMQDGWVYPISNTFYYSTNFLFDNDNDIHHLGHRLRS